MTPAIQTIASVIIVSIISFSGALTLVFKKDFLHRILILLVSFSAGALLGDSFIHLLPETVKEFGGLTLTAGFYVLTGIITFFILEKIILWQHCHHPGEEGHEACIRNVKSYAINNLIADGLHNFLDGAIIAGSYLVSPTLGVSTTLAVIFHEIPQEIGDFGVLVHGGFSTNQALFFNFLSALLALVGAIATLILEINIKGLSIFLVAFTAGSFIYIAASDLIPQLHKQAKPLRSLVELCFFIFGIGVMLLLALIE